MTENFQSQHSSIPSLYSRGMQHIQQFWGAIQYPLLAYLVMRFYYSIFAAVLTLIFHQPYEGVVGYFDPFSKYFLMNWQHWDTIWYLRIALQGYHISDGRSVFPPVYPFLIRVLNVLSGNYLLTAFVISSLAGCIAVILLYLLTKELFGEKIAELSVLVLLVFPTATFFYGAYTEPIFLALTLAMYYASKCGKFGLAGAFAALATLTRYQGVILAIPLGWMIWKDVSKQERVWKTFVYPAIPILSLLIFWWIRGEWIDPNSIGKVYEDYWQSRFGFPGENILISLIELHESSHVYNFINWLDISLLITILIITPFIVRLLNPEYWLYQISTLLVLLLRIGPIENPLQGMGRYMLLMFPTFMIIANWLCCGRKKLILIPSLILSTWILAIFILGIGLM